LGLRKVIHSPYDVTGLREETAGVLWSVRALISSNG
ncbi:hypothetical protein T4B_2312, partial [Trichinella pseudospiralis]